MPIPIILGGLALSMAGYGAKKGYDAYEDNDTADKYNKRAKNIYDEATDKLLTSREKTNQNFKNIGKLKASIYEDTLGDFVEIFSNIKNVDFEDNLNLGINLPNDYQKMIELKTSVLDIKEIIGGGLAALGGGAAAGFGAFGSVGLLATASTGTAIGGLSGIAATNATLAWLGGGSIATGGGGIALGTTILGGIAFAPILAVGGAIFAAKAEEAKFNSYANFDKAEASAKEMEVTTIVLKEISTRIEEFANILKPLDEIFEDYIEKMEDIVDESNDYSKYSDDNKKVILITVSIAQTIKNICDAPIIDEEGKVTRKSKRVIKKAKKFILKLEEV
ncbi:MAG: hypothetical protein DRG78_12960 [Epsilonproteobacteria bacterium]|nr:MAG: hypothetical protein DRG78_12960 [Campylobacterota bacterium]